MQPAGRAESAHMSLRYVVAELYAFLMNVRVYHVRMRARPALAMCALGRPVYRKYRKARGKKWAPCSGDEAHTLWCVLSLQWRGSSSKVQKGKTGGAVCVCCVHVCGLLRCFNHVYFLLGLLLFSCVF